MLPSERVMQMEEEEKQEQEEKKRRRDPPIVFKDLVDVKSEYVALCNLLEGKLNDEERVCMEELRQYVLENEGSWALGDNFLNFVGESTNNSAASLTQYFLVNNARVSRTNSVRQIVVKRHEGQTIEYTFRRCVEGRCDLVATSGQEGTYYHELCF